MSRVTDVANGVGAAALVGVGVTVLFQHEPAPNTWFTLRWPADIEPEAATALLRHLAAAPQPAVLVIEVRWGSTGIEHRLGVTDDAGEQLIDSFGSFLPGTLLEPSTTARQATPDPRRWRGIELRLSTRERALRSDAALDTSRSIITALAEAAPGTTIQWLLGPRLAPHHVSGQSVGSPSTSRWLVSTLLGRDERLDSRERTEFRDKVSEHGFRATCRLIAPTDNALRRLLGALRVAEGPGSHLRARSARPGHALMAQPPRRWPMAINVRELVGLLGWPLGDEPYPGVQRVAARQLPIAARVPSRGRVIGDGTAPSTRRPMAQTVSDALMHCLLLGPTGTGKSTLMASLALQDIAAGRGVVVIDPKADLIDAIAVRIPPERLDDVVVIDPSDDTPVGLNPLVRADGEPELMVDQLMGMFRGLYGDQLGPRSSDILHSSLRAIAVSDAPTLCALPLLLTDERYRRRVAGDATDAFGTRPFFEWFARLSPAEAANVTAPLLNKLRPFIARPALRAMLGQTTPRFAISDVFTKRRIVLVKLGSGAVGPEAARLLGSLVLSQLWMAAQTRAHIAPERRHPVLAYVDEWHTMLHTSVDLGDMLTAARGLGLGLVLANQHLHQLPPALRSAALANARSTICFRLGAEDAAILARSTALLEPRDFQQLDRYEVYASIVADSAVTPFASATTRPLPAATTNTNDVYRRSRERYGVARTEVDAALLELAGNDRPSGTAGGPIGKRKRGSA